MNRRQLLVGSTTAITAVLAGCTASAQTDGEPESETADERTISVQKQGEVEAEPDEALVRTSIEVTGDDASSVRDDLSDRADELRDGLLAAGLADDQITTDRFQVRDRIDRERAEQAEADGERVDEEDLDEFRYYEGSHRFQIEVRDIDEVGSVVDTAIDSGADSVGRIEFRLSEERQTELREEALELALDDARTEADFVASEVDASVVEVQAVDTTEGRVSTVRADVEEVTDDEMADDSVEAEASTDIDTDDVTVQATAAVRYRIS